MTLRYPTTSGTLLERIAAGDEIGWDEFFERYSPVIKAVAKISGVNDTVADDIVQQVMLQFFQQSRTFRFDPERARFRTFFGRIIQAKIADHFRREKRLPVIDPEIVSEEAVLPECDSIFMEEWRKTVLKDAEEQLKQKVSPETFLAYELYAVQGRSPAKIAAYLSCSVNQVYQAKKRCFAVLRDILGQLNDGDPELGLRLEKYDLESR